MPDLSHLWQRFVLALTLVFGLAVGIGATIFGYSNTDTVNVGFAVWRLNGVPLWAVALVPLAIALVVGMLYHWWNNLHHFTEYMQHRRRVRDLEAEVASLKEHLDHLLEMPDQGGKPKPAPVAVSEPEPEPEPEETEVVAPQAAVEPDESPSTSNGEDSATRPPSSRKRASLKIAAPSEPAVAGDNGEPDEAPPESSEAANS